MNFDIFKKKINTEYSKLCGPLNVYRSLDHSWIAIFEIVNKKNLYLDVEKQLTKTPKILVLRLVINKFDFTTKNSIVIEKLGLKAQLNNIILKPLAFSKSLEKEFYTHLTNHPSYTGKIKKWYSNGILMSTGDYFNNQKNGYWMSWYNNGQIHIKGKFIDNKKIGEFIEYSKLGTIYRKSSFVNDLLDGEYAVYYPDEKLKKYGVYKNGQKIGIWNYYDSHDGITITKNYK